MAKIRQGFVSNSSSASFILIITTVDPILDDFKDINEFGNYLKREINFSEFDNEDDIALRFLKQVDDYTCKVECQTSMLNYITDIPQSMKDIYLSKILDIGLFNVENVTLKVVED